MKSFDSILPHAVLEVRETLFSCASETCAATALRFFKTGAGAYGEGDRFIGVRVPEVRKIARDFAPKLSPEEVLPLLRDTVHECRLLALLVWVQQFSKGDERIREKIVSLYLSHTTYINNWDLVDLSAPGIVGEYLKDKLRKDLYRLADSPLLWDQRIAVVSTYTLIKNGDFIDILALSERLLHHKHDLMQKAVGWMLREMGKRDKDLLVQFLEKYCRTMPRTMLRYAIEKFPEEERKEFMKR